MLPSALLAVLYRVEVALTVPKRGAGIGLIGGALKHGAEKRRAEQNFDDQTQSVMRNCMVGRGYTVLN